MNASVLFWRPRQHVLDVGSVVAHLLDQTPELASVRFVIEQPDHGVRARIATFAKRTEIAPNHVRGGLHANAESGWRLVAAECYHPRISKEIVHA